MTTQVTGPGVGGSSRTSLLLHVLLMSDYHICGCSGFGCRCCAGYLGSLDWKGPEAGFSGWCTPAPCHIPNSTHQSGPACQCADGFTGGISWTQANASGQCVPASCELKGSNMMSGPSCACANGFIGNISWVGSIPVGLCVPVQ